uniref:Uncharacterized protein n=1 Tax=Cacopsylla melanoneura TaxID=428564 RepID=A0A8D8U120_9HEMI
MDTPSVVSHRLRGRIAQEEEEDVDKLKSGAAGKTAESNGPGASKRFPRSAERVVRQLIPEGRKRRRQLDPRGKAGPGRAARVSRRVKMSPSKKPLDTPRKPGISPKVSKRSKK